MFENVVTKFVKIVNNYPDKLAVYSKEGSFTFSEFYHYAKRIAFKLKSIGIKSQDRVTIEIGRNYFYLPIVYGCWLLNVTAVLTDQDYPEDRKKYISECSKAKFRLTKDFISNLQLDEINENNFENIKENDIAFVTFTSGSTGKPKGVLHNHYNFYNRVLCCNGFMNLTPNDRYANQAPFSFIGGIILSNVTLLFSASLYLVPEDARMNVDKLADFYADNEITCAFLPPQMGKIFKQKKKTLRFLILGGEKAINVYSSEFQMINCYGATESEGPFMIYEIDKCYTNTPFLKTYGGEKAYLLNDNLEKVDEGEIYFAGYLCSGYIDLEKENKEKFIKNPFQNEDGFPTLFKSGDIARRDKDGKFYYLDRKDWMVNINGQRVEPGEISSALSGFNKINKAFVRSFKNNDDQDFLVAYYISEVEVTDEEMRNFLSKKLPKYMIPSYFVKMESFPLNANGKINRNEFKNPLKEKVINFKDFSNKFKNDSEVALKIRTLLYQTTGNEDIPFDEKLSNYGLSSLSAIKLANDLKNIYNVDLNVLDLISNASIKSLEKEIKNSKNKKIIKTKNVTKDKYLLTKTQYGMYNSYFTNRDSTMYNIPFRIKLLKKDYPSINLKRLKGCIEDVFNAHPTLKVSIEIRDDGLTYMIPHNDDDVSINVFNDVKDIEKFERDFVKPLNLEEHVYRVSIVDNNTEFIVYTDVHHLMFDGTSLNIFRDDMLKALNGESLNEETFSMFDESILEEKEVKSNKYQLAKKHYEKVLGGVESNTLIEPDLCLDGVKKGFIKKDLNLEGNTISKLCQELKVGENSFFLSCLGLLLSKYNYVNYSIFATGFSGRNNGRYSNLIGMLVKTLPIYSDFSSPLKVKDYIKAINKQYLDGCQNTLYSFAEINEEYGITSDLMFVYQGIFDQAEDSLNSTLNIEDIKNQIQIQVYPNGSKFTIDITYNACLFSKHLIEEIIESYDYIGKILISNLNEIINNLSIISTNQIKEIDSFNKTETSYDESSTLIDKIVSFSKSNPKHEAVVYKDKSLNYKEFDEYSNALANYLIKKGIKRGDFVAILLDRSEFLPVTAVGVNKAGAIYEPLDPNYPTERLYFMLEDTKTKVLITNKKLKPLLSKFKGEVFLIENLKELKDKSLPNTLPRPEDGLVILYTSGSTGVPKGCSIIHKNAMAYNAAVKDIINASPSSRSGFYASFGFDAGFSSMYITLSNGGTIVIVPEEIRLNLEAIDEYFIEHKVTYALFTTQVGRLYSMNHKCETIKCLTMGGEAMAPFKPVEGFTSINGYGPTETLCCVTANIVTNDDKIQPIGKAHPNIKLYVVDKNLNMLPIGASGELCIAGDQVSNGYLNRPEKTAEVFVKNPFTSQKGYERIYRTGDVVRYMNDGKIQYIGRKDSQVKIRGFRIELTEVEQIIGKFKGISEVTVQAFDDKSGGKFLAAYVVGKSKINIENLKTFIGDNKPAYMIPKVILQINKIPLNVNGKVDKKKLPIPTIKFDEIVKPTNETEQKIYDILKEVLNDDSFGITTDVYEAGLSSISSIKFLYKISTEFKKSVEINDLKDNSTIAKLARFLSNKDEEEGPKKLDYYSLTKTQEGIFVEYLSSPNSTKYNIPYLMKIQGNLDEKKLKQAIVKTINSHSFLKTKFFYNSEGNIQMSRKEEYSFSEKDIEVLETKNIKEIIDVLVKPYDLIKERLFRIKIIKSDSLYLFLEFHHIICDGTSLGIILQDISSNYLGKDAPKEVSSGYDVSYFESEKRKSPIFEKAKLYYEKLLSGFDTDFLPGGDLYKNSKLDSGVLKLNCNQNIGNKINEFLAKNKVSENALFNSAFGYTLSVLNGTDYSIYTTVYNGRNNSRLERTTSMLVKTIPVICHTKDACLDLVNDMSKQLLDSMAYDIFSFSEIVKETDIKPEIMFIYQGDNFEFNSFCGKKISNVDLSLSEEKEPLVFLVNKHGANQYEYSLEYDNNRFSQHFIECFVNLFSAILEGLISKKLTKEISLINNSNRKLLDSFRNNDLKYSTSNNVLKIFKENVKKYPNHIASYYEKKTFTYKEMDSITDKIASYILKKGLKPNDFVAILSSRNEHITYLPLGVLKSGAAYQPLDSSYPKERLNFMIKDSNAKLLICERKLRNLLDEYEGDVLYIDEITKLPKGKVFDFNKINLNDAFVILYTSGTTGTPKGCILTHGNLLAHFTQYNNYFHMGKDDRFATYASFGFDANMMDTFATLCSGSTLYIVPEDIRLNFLALDKYYIENKITYTMFTTQVGRMFNTISSSTYLKVILIGGEKLVPVTPNSHARLINGYGPTETTAYVSLFEVKDDSKLLPIGKPNANVKFYVVDKYMRELPPICNGELLICGPQVSKGYLNRPEKTNEVYLKNPFCSDAKYSRVYKSGDIVRYLPDGNIDFVGRRDGQVKIRGFRVELSEVEKIIHDFPGIKDATVQAFTDPNGGKFIAGYFVSDNKINIDEIKSFILEKKPSYMVPAFIMQIDSIPLNINSKVDKKKLPIPTTTNIREGLEASNETEKTICKLYEEILGLNKVFADDNFFEIGGTSILAGKLVINAMNAGLSVVYKNIFDNPTPKALAAFIANQKMIAGSTTKHEIVNKDTVSKYAKVLEYNTKEKIEDITKLREIKNVLLTGVTGFLGSHILKELLLNEDINVYVLARGNKDQSAKERLKVIFMYYFAGLISEKALDRVKIIEADVTSPDLLSLLKNVTLDTIINCAAIVKHFSADDSIETVNVGGVKNLIKVAKAHKALLTQISTLSIAGESVNDDIDPNIKLTENMFEFGQNIENKYIHSKFHAEEEMLKAIEDGMEGKIIRVGNLMPRYSDGEFQINFNTNGFMSRLKSYYLLGYFPIGDLDANVEFSPIDSTAKSIIELCKTGSKYTVFHSNNCHNVHMYNVLNIMKAQGLDIKIVPDEEFFVHFQDKLKDPKHNIEISSLISYLGNEGEKRRMIDSDNSFTVNALYRLNFAWPIIGDSYIANFIESLKALRFFKK